MNILALGGKPDYIAHISGDRTQTVADHCRNVAILASENLGKFGLAKTGYLAGLVHDMGKYSDEFQQYIRITDQAEKKAKRGSVIHSFAAVRQMLTSFHHDPSQELGFSDAAAELIAYAAGAHHGLFDILSPEPDGDEDGFLHRMNRQPETDDVSADRFFRFCASENEIKRLFDTACLEISNALEAIDVSIDRIPGGRKSEIYDFQVGLLARLILSAVIDADRMDASAFEGIEMPSCRKTTWSEVEEEICSFTRTLRRPSLISIARQDFSDACHDAASRGQGIYRLDMPTGAGKTLSGLRFAVTHAKLHDMDRIYYVAPLLSIIDQNEAVFRKAMPSVPVLAHHSDMTPKTRTTNENRIDEDLLKENWNNPAIVTTLARLLEVLFGSSTSDIRRFISLGNSVLLLDEVQSVPLKMVHMFNMAMDFLGGFCHSTIVLASATQPTFDDTDYPMAIKDGLVPLSMYREYEETFRRTSLVYAGSGTLEDASGFVRHIADEQNSLLVVCNTKKEAETVFDGLPSSGRAKFHLSAGMCPAHRKRVIGQMEDLRSQGEPVVCVATQVIEAGVDISFGCVIRFAAGLDNAVQAAGRGNRNGEYECPVPVYIYVINNEKLGGLDEIRASKNAFLRLESYLESHPGITMDSQEAVARYYSYRYMNRSKEMSYEMENSTMVDFLSGNRRAVRKAGGSPWFLRQAFSTAAGCFQVYGDEQIPVIVPYGDGAETIRKLSGNPDIRKLAGILREARQYTVSVYENTFIELEQAGAIRETVSGNIVAYCLAEGFYDTEKGVVTCR